MTLIIWSEFLWKSCDVVFTTGLLLKHRNQRSLRAVKHVVISVKWFICVTLILMRLTSRLDEKKLWQGRGWWRSVHLLLSPVKKKTTHMFQASWTNSQMERQPRCAPSLLPETGGPEDWIVLPHAVCSHCACIHIYCTHVLVLSRGVMSTSFCFFWVLSKLEPISEGWKCKMFSGFTACRLMLDYYYTSQMLELQRLEHDTKKNIQVHLTKAPHYTCQTEKKNMCGVDLTSN